MSDNDNNDLIKFLEKQFEGIYQRLDNTPTKDDLEDVKRHTGVLIEAVEHKIDTVIEGLMGVNEKLDRRTNEHDDEHSRLEKRVLINTAGISELDQRVGRLERKA